jgi:hypothetical protein
VKLACSEQQLNDFNKPVIVSVTTSPLRIKWLSTVLNCLDLSLVDEIAVNLP